MSHSWEIITESLRNELQEYGALLGLYEEQQANLLRRDPDAVLASAEAIEAQVGRSQQVRETRERLVRAFANNHGASPDTPLRGLLNLFPVDVQPLIEALVSEINRLIHRIRRGARQNQTLLARAVETHEAIVRLMRPTTVNKTYSARGNVTVANTNPAWQAAG